MVQVRKCELTVDYEFLYLILCRKTLRFVFQINIFLKKYQKHFKYFVLSNENMKLFLIIVICFYKIIMICKFIEIRCGYLEFYLISTAHIAIK